MPIDCQLKGGIMVLTNTEIKDLIFALLDCREKLLWLVNQIPTNEEQIKFIEGGKELLEKVNQGLKDFNIELPV